MTKAESRVNDRAQATRGRVLVVDDNRDGAETLAVLLHALGHEVRSEFSGHSAFRTVLDFAPDIVLLDVGLDGISGYDIGRMLRADPRTRDIFIVAITGFSDEDNRQRSFEAGFDAHRIKPAEIADLQQLLAQGLRQRADRRALQAQREPARDRRATA
jgi:CheY-like chemotaxis protein